MSSPCPFVVPKAHRASRSANDAGFTLVALIMLMTLMALFAMAAAPSILQQSQREREKEAIFRGEEVADAIRLYHTAQVGTGRPAGEPSLPTDIDQLVEGVQISGRTKKLQILRASAAHDPLSSTGDWILVRPHSPEIADFLRSVTVYAGNVRPPTNDRFLGPQAFNLAPAVIVISGLEPSQTTSSSGLSSASTGPFIGVSSDSKLDSVITYYGIEKHNQWVFTPLFR